MLEENTTFYNNVVNFSLNVTTFGMVIDIVEMDKSHDCCCYGNQKLDGGGLKLSLVSLNQSSMGQRLSYDSFQ